MGIETFNFIDSLNTANPTDTDNVSEGDDHIRGIKTTIKNTFPNVNAAVTPTDEELNVVDMSTSGSTSGQLLTSNGTGTAATWQDAPVSLPDQTGQAGEYLTTDGSIASWSIIPDTGSLYTESATAPVSPTNGDLWLDTDYDTLYQQQTSAWVQVSTTNMPTDKEGVDVLSTGETGGVKYLREDGDGTSSWQEVAGVSDLNDLDDATLSVNDPTTDTNPSTTGHLWVNSTSGEAFVCTDNTSGSNVWTNIGEGVDGVVPPVWYGGRGVFAGGESAYQVYEGIEYITISTTGNATDFGDLTSNRRGVDAPSNGTRGVFAGGYNNSILDYITIATTGNATDFGDMSVWVSNPAAVSNGPRGVYGGGSSMINTIAYITIDTTGNATDFGDLTVSRYGSAGVSDGTRGVFAGGGGWNIDVMDYITIDTTGNATDFGDTISSAYQDGCSDSTRGVICNGSSSEIIGALGYITIATTGNTTIFGDLVVGGGNKSATSDGTRGIFAGGHYWNNYKLEIDYITIATTGNATDFGDLTTFKSAAGACSGD